MHALRADPAGTAATPAAWPAPPEAWQETIATLHMWLQIVGMTRMALAPTENHWWHVTLLATPRGLTTGSIPWEGSAFAVEFDFVTHRLSVINGNGDERIIPLMARSVADFHSAYMGVLRSQGIGIAIGSGPAEVEDPIPFAQDIVHESYDAHAVSAWWRIMLQVDRVMKRYRGEFLGKSSPVHFFWGGFDLAVTRFSGRRAPRHPGGVANIPDRVVEEAYSHECISCGFWPGSGPVKEPAFYAYAYPEPGGYSDRRIGQGAYYSPELREFILPYESVRCADDPDETLLSFLHGSYEAAADLGSWNRKDLERAGAWDHG